MFNQDVLLYESKILTNIVDDCEFDVLGEDPVLLGDQLGHQSPLLQHLGHQVLQHRGEVDRGQLANTIVQHLLLPQNPVNSSDRKQQPCTE